MPGRKHISARKRAAIFALALGDVPYADAKKMTEDQILSLYHLDHNMLYENKHPDRDEYWNYTPRLIREHREKTKRDAAIIAKGRRIRAKNLPLGAGNQAMIAMSEAISAGLAEGTRHAYERMQRPRDLYSENYSAIAWDAHGGTKPKGVRKLRSRGFDKTKRRKMDGTVVKR